jgi:hypothetical protein
MFKDIYFISNTSWEWINYTKDSFPNPYSSIIYHHLVLRNNRERYTSSIIDHHLTYVTRRKRYNIWKMMLFELCTHASSLHMWITLKLNERKNKYMYIQKQSKFLFLVHSYWKQQRNHKIQQNKMGECVHRTWIPSRPARENRSIIPEQKNSNMSLNLWINCKWFV